MRDIDLKLKAAQIRKGIIEAVYSAKSGHPNQYHALHFIPFNLYQSRFLEISEYTTFNEG